MPVDMRTVSQSHQFRWEGSLFEFRRSDWPFDPIPSKTSEPKIDLKAGIAVIITASGLILYAWALALFVEGVL
jgi:hypothetical protein